MYAGRVTHRIVVSGLQPSSLFGYVLYVFLVTGTQCKALSLDCS